MDEAPFNVAAAVEVASGEKNVTEVSTIWIYWWDS
jgi:hypothetical protein